MSSEALQMTTRSLPPHPRQPMMFDDKGAMCHRPNLIIKALIDTRGIDLRAAAANEHAADDIEQIRQLGGGLALPAPDSPWHSLTYAEIRRSLEMQIELRRLQQPIPALTAVLGEMHLRNEDETWLDEPTKEKWEGATAAFEAAIRSLERAIVNHTIGPHPLQPFVFDEEGRLCFRPNRILLDLTGPADFSLASLINSSDNEDDQMQVAQLMGTVVEDFPGLSYAMPAVLREIDIAVDRFWSTNFKPKSFRPRKSSS